jgi:hypothetical protein
MAGEGRELMYRALLTVMLGLLIVACADESGDGERIEQSGSGPGPSNEPVPTTSDSPSQQRDPVSAAVASLAAESGADPADIAVVAHHEVTWRNGSLGCPEPGKMYTQALVDGYRIVLRADGVEYYYHGAADEPPVRCDEPDPNGALAAEPSN